MSVVEFLGMVNDEFDFLHKNNFEINDIQLTPLFDTNKYIIDSYGKPLSYSIKNLCLNNIKLLTVNNTNDIYHKSNLYLAAFYTAYYLETYDKSYLKTDVKGRPFKTICKIRRELLSKTDLYKDDKIDIEIIEIISAFGEALINISLLKEPIDIRRVIMSYNYIVKILNVIKKRYDDGVETLHVMNKEPYSPTISNSIEKHYDIIDFIDEIIEDVGDDLNQVVEFEFIQ